MGELVRERGGGTLRVMESECNRGGGCSLVGYNTVDD